MKDLAERTYDSVLSLDSWIRKNGWKGWDPYDIKGIRWVIKIASLGNKYNFYKYFREFLYEAFYMFPLSCRKILAVKQTINPKAMALFASAYLQLYRITGEQEHLDTCQVSIKWLLDHTSKTESGLGWGYPFDWQSEVLIPKNTPNGIVTTAVGDAVWNYYKFSNDPVYLDICRQIGDFLSDLPHDRTEEDKICFSYTPLFINHVHNLNLFIAEFLIKTGMETNNTEWIRLGNHAVNYTIADQKPDGSFDYNGPPENPADFVDNYHTGFVLRMLHSIWKLTGRKDVHKSMDICFNHYTNSFFENQEIPKLLPNRKYRIDIHSCAESILCISELSETYPDQLQLADNILKWTFNNLQDSKGFFYYGILKSRITGSTYKSKIPYIRWSQAWMLKALSTRLSKSVPIGLS